MNRLRNIWIVRQIRGLRRKIHRTLQWLPIVWRSYDFSYICLFIVIRHKLQMMERHHRHYGIAMESERVIDEIKFAIKLLNRIIERDYDENALIQHNRKWGALRMYSGEVFDHESSVKVLLRRDNCRTWKDYEQERKEFRRAIAHAEKVRRHDVEALFNHVARHYRKWWD